MSDYRRAKVHLSLGPRSYDVLIGPGVLGELGGVAERLELGRTVAIVTAAPVSRLYAPAVQSQLLRTGRAVHVMEVPSGERCKTLRRAGLLYKELLRAGFDRNSWILGLGGGATGDLAGFVAATYMRGIDYVQAPTTLLAQVDASVGGKTAVNLPAAKNVVGAFHQARAVLTDLDPLASLSARDVRSGLAEVVKHGAIADRALFEFVADHAAELRAREVGPLIHVIRRSCEIKAAVVEADEREHGLRAVLNFGHTIGHALEATQRSPRLRHGEAVGLGMIAEARLGRLLGRTPAECEGALRSVLTACGLRTVVKIDDREHVLETCRHDKKAADGRQKVALLSELGQAELCRDVPMRALSASLEAIEV